MRKIVCFMCEFCYVWEGLVAFSGGKRVYVTKVDDIMFRKPVEIGSLVYLSSQVRT